MALIRIERRLQAAKGGLDLPKNGVVLTHAAAWPRSRTSDVLVRYREVKWEGAAT